MSCHNSCFILVNIIPKLLEVYQQLKAAVVFFFFFKLLNLFFIIFCYHHPPLFFFTVLTSFWNESRSMLYSQPSY